MALYLTIFFSFGQQNKYFTVCHPCATFTSKWLAMYAEVQDYIISKNKILGSSDCHRHIKVKLTKKVQTDITGSVPSWEHCQCRFANLFDPNLCWFFSKETVFQHQMQRPGSWEKISAQNTTNTNRILPSKSGVHIECVTDFTALLAFILIMYSIWKASKPQ